MRSTYRTRSGLSAVVMAVALGTGCLIDDPNHCANQEGDATCAAQGGGQCSACVAANNGCVMETPGPACHAATATLGDSGSDSDSQDASDSASETGEPGECSSEGLDEACPEEAPYCSGGVCTSCDAGGGDAFCAGLDEAKPVCLGGAGVCVACMEEATSGCPEAKPFCNDAYECSGCTEHSQCPESACNLRTGACMNPGRVWWVDKDGCTGSGTGTSDDPYCDIGTAVTNVKTGESGVVKIVPGVSPYAESVIITANQDRVVALLGAGGKASISGENWALNVSTHDVFASNLILLSAAQQGVRCTNHGNVWLDDSSVQSNAQGMFVDNCKVRVRRTRFVGNDGDGVALENGAELTMTSSVIGANGDDAAETVGLRAVDSSFTIRYGTIAHNFGSAVAGIDCTGADGSLVRNSVVVGPQLSTIACDGTTFENSFIDTMGLSGTGNVVIDQYNETWFEDVADLDFHIRFGDTSPFRDVALWELGDPSFDMDKAPRPGIPGTTDFAGADVP